MRPQAGLGPATGPARGPAATARSFSDLDATDRQVGLGDAACPAHLDLGLLFCERWSPGMT